MSLPRTPSSPSAVHAHPTGPTSRRLALSLDGLERAQEVLGVGLARGAQRLALHPGQLAWHLAEGMQQRKAKLHPRRQPVEGLQLRSKGASRLELGLQLRCGLCLDLRLLELRLLHLCLKLGLLDLRVDLGLLELSLRVVLRVGIAGSAPAHGESGGSDPVLCQEVRNEIPRPGNAIRGPCHDDPWRLPAACLTDFEVCATLVLDLRDHLPFWPDELGDDALIYLHVFHHIPDDGLVAGSY
mmetsp:Transcript_93982/g.265991  ORF Transcript_93982/g.265991 Transcript_93982/m.265991 type:complete len:241 (+) Transcript_93982:382-1104(+)